MMRLIARIFSNVFIYINLRLWYMPWVAQLNRSRSISWFAALINEAAISWDKVSLNEEQQELAELFNY